MYKVSSCLSAIGVGLGNDPGLGRGGGDTDEDGEEGKIEHGWPVKMSEDGSTNFPYIGAQVDFSLRL